LVIGVFDADEWPLTSDPPKDGFAMANLCLPRLSFSGGGTYGLCGGSRLLAARRGGAKTFEVLGCISIGRWTFILF
jgi:hypothetical protein